MDAVGTLEIAWSTGYRGDPVAFVAPNALCFPCANSISFYDLEAKPLHTHESLGKAIGHVAAHSRGIFAYTDRSLPPRLFVVSYPDFALQSELKGAAELEFRAIAFSANGKYFVSLAGVPDFKLCVWETATGNLVCKSDVTSWPSVNRVSVYQTNWKQICMTGPDCCLIWSVEECGGQFMLTHANVALPEIDMPSGTKRSAAVVAAGTKEKSTSSKKTNSAVKPYYPFGLGSIVGDFGDFDDDANRAIVRVTDHCWAPGGILYCACDGGQIFSIDVDSMDVVMVHNPESVVGDDFRLSSGFADCLALNKRGVFVSGKEGLVKCLGLSNDTPSVLESIDIEQAVVSMVWSPDFSRLIAGTSQGSLLCFSSSRLKDNRPILEHRTDALIGLDILRKGDEHCVTCRQNGLLQLWTLSLCSEAGFIDLNSPCRSIASSASSASCAVGTADGNVIIVDAQTPDDMRVVDRSRLHQNEVTHLKFDPTGSFLVTAGRDRRIFICSARPTQRFEVLGYLTVDDSVSNLAVTGSKDVAYVCVTVDRSLADTTPFPTRFFTFEIETHWRESVPSSAYSDSTCLFSSPAVKLRSFDLDVPVSGIDVGYLPDDDGLELFALSKKSKTLYKYKLPEFAENAKDEVDLLSPQSQHQGHLFRGGNVFISPHGRWLATCSSDGSILTRLTASLDRSVSVLAHDYSTGGAAALCFTGDCQRVLSAGADGSLSCFTWKFSGQGKAKGSKAVDAFRSRSAALKKVVKREDECLAGMKPLERKGDETTWLDRKIAEAHRLEDEKYAELKADIRKNIATLRENVLKKIQLNSEVPEMERLERQEFNLDTEEQQRLMAVSSKQIEEVREEIELENMRKLYVTEMLKKECWDSMEITGKTITGFGNNLEVRNYPIRKRLPSEVEELDFILTQRRIEIAELDAQADICKAMPKHPLGFDDDDEGVDEGPGDANSLALHGSRGPEFGGGDDFFYSQTEIMTAERKRNQIVLLNNCISKIKRNYNKDFDDLLQQKEAEVARIQEKNVRIKKIMKNLQLNETTFNPQTGANEHPELDLTVKDDEVTVAKYVSEEEQKRIEEENRLAEERRIAEMGDNARERALDMMMGGRLEVKTEEDIFKDLPKPEFVTTKATEMWTEDEQKIAKEYEKKQAALLEEREKHRLALEAELKKLQTSITEACAAFDLKVLKLHHLRIKAEAAVYQEELKILRLTWSLLIEEELAEKEELLQLKLEEKKTRKMRTGSLLSEFRKQVETVKENYEALVQDDKALDRSFKKDFSDCEPHVDVLYKCFKRRPRGQHKISAIEPDSSDVDPSSYNPYSVRPSSAAAARGAHALAAALDELDGESYRPDGVETTAWQRLVVARRLKVEKEQQVKSVALQLAEMNSFLQKRLKEDGDVQQEIEKTFRELNKLREERIRVSQNLEMQLLLKQGQVEVNPGNFIPDFRDSVLVHRSVIEDLNATIKTLGDGKIAAMNESKDFRKNIALLEWEHKKLNMEAEDLRDKARRIQLLKVTKELQAALLEEDTASHQQNISTLEETIALTEEAHNRRRADHKRRVAKLRRRIHEKANENARVDDELEGLAVDVAERQNVERAQSQYPSDGGMEKKMRDIRARRRLVETAKSQAQEVAVLRAEAQRLRMRAFPTLIHGEQY